MALTKATQNVITPEIVTKDTSQTITGTKTFSTTIIGNTDTSTKLLTARTINGIAFDGTADITIPTGGSSSAKAWVNFDGTTTSANLSGTYSQSLTTVTITTATAHGLSQGQGIYANFTTGNGVDGSYTVATIISPTVFTYTAASLTASGNVTLNRSSIRAQYNVSSITKNGTGDYNVNFTTAMTDANYTWAMGSSYVGTNGFIEDNMVSQTINSIRMKLLYGAVIDLNSAPTVCITIFGN